MAEFSSSVLRSRSADVLGSTNNALRGEHDELPPDRVGEAGARTARGAGARAVGLPAAPFRARTDVVLDTPSDRRALSPCPQRGQLSTIVAAAGSVALERTLPR